MNNNPETEKSTLEEPLEPTPQWARRSIRQKVDLLNARYAELHRLFTGSYPKRPVLSDVQDHAISQVDKVADELEQVLLENKEVRKEWENRRAHLWIPSGNPGESIDK